MKSRFLVALQIAAIIATPTVMILGSPALAQAPSLAKKHLHLQTAFDLESPMTRTVRVPPAVLQQLATDHDVQEFLDARMGTATEVLGAFEAAPAQISTAGSE